MDGQGRASVFNDAYGTTFGARRWLAVDSCGCFGVSLSWSVHIYALLVNAIFVIPKSAAASLIFFFLYIPCSLLAMTSLFKAWTTDPGAVPMGARPLTIVRRASSNLSNSDGGGNNNNLVRETAVNGAHSGTTPLTSQSSLEDPSLAGGNPSLLSETSQQLPPPSAPSVTTTQRAVRRCHKCQDNYKPPRAHHDSVTGRCIVKFDHFCPWVGNAVGALNHKFFCLFLLYTSGTCLLSMLLLIMRAIRCGYIMDPEAEQEAMDANAREYGKEEDANAAGDNAYHHLTRWLDTKSSDFQDETMTHFKYPECHAFYNSHLVLGLLLASVLFLVFTCSMGCEQIEAIETGQGKIARMKQRVGMAGTEYSRVTEEFNEMFGGDSPRLSLHWFNPLIPVEFPRGMKKVVLGYDYDPDVVLSSSTGYFSTGGAAPVRGGLDDIGDQEMQDLEGGKRSPTPVGTSAGRDGLLRATGSDVSINQNETIKLRKQGVTS